MATEKNLELIKAKGYNYLCVSRTKLTDYSLKDEGRTVTTLDEKSTQKAITTEADNALGEKVTLRLCSDPTDSAAEIYRAPKYNEKPFRKYTITQPPAPPD